MAGVPKIEITESIEELKLLMKQQRKASGYAKIRSLYLLKVNTVKTIKQLAVILNRKESTIHHWLHKYKTGGLSFLLEESSKKERLKKNELIAKIQQELSDSQGLNHYQEKK